MQNKRGINHEEKSNAIKKQPDPLDQVASS